ncbi:MAG TPA: peptide chain release factor H [Bacteroidia bacterium]|nr:peptide chain release factor H [Bacteroidia bacterium]
MEEKIMQITSGKGPAECERVVARLLEKIVKAAERERLSAEAIELVPGKPDDTLLSALVRIKGEHAASFCASWEGTVQWIAQSPFRKNHKRKNWFAGITVYDVAAFPQWNEKEVSYQTMRASGPGGQHVNKTESAVRATHVPTGISVTASDERSQMMNKKAATERLKNKLLSAHVEENSRRIKSKWQEHNELVRGDAKHVFRVTLE